MDFAYVLDPRFSGGTSAAVAQELRSLAEGPEHIRVHGISSAMFRGTDIAPVLGEALEDIGLALEWDPDVIAAERVILHNPAFLKFDTALAPRILARDLVIVTHENFLRPSGQEAFDIEHCLALVDKSSLAIRKWLAPISPYNRQMVREWLRRSRTMRHWQVLPQDWFNICAFEMEAPTPRPRDRRGRHSRPGYEKFPPVSDMDRLFPPTAERNFILGADRFIADKIHRPHWQMVPFRGVTVGAFFQQIDFHVYFTAPTWRESFGRVLAEAIAAGKLVISDAATASTFHGGVLAGKPDEVDDIIAHHLCHPQKYRAQVKTAQERLRAFSAERLRSVIRNLGMAQSEAVK